MYNEIIKVTGELRLTAYRDGKVLFDRFLKNTITTVGKAHIADQMSDQGDTVMSHLAVGTGTGGGASSTTLQTELYRKVLASITQGSAGNANKVTYSVTINAGEGTGALTEYGIFNDATAGTILAYREDSVYNKLSTDSLVVNWTITYS